MPSYSRRSKSRRSASLSRNAKRPVHPNNRSSSFNNVNNATRRRLHPGPTRYGRALDITSLEEVDACKEAGTCAIVRSLIIHGNRAKNETVPFYKFAEIAPLFTGIHTLSLNRNGIGNRDSGSDIITRTLENFTELRTLEITYNWMGYNTIPKVVKAFSRFPHLTTLVLWANELTHSSVESLIEGLMMLPKLTHLDLRHCHINDEGAYVLAQFLKKTNTLTTLYLSGNAITDRGAHDFASVLHYLTELKTLHIDNNKITGEGEKEMRATAREGCYIQFEAPKI
jgi:Ran GTPase-activating protein (RanGAP) involved in mRNA processing and transport